MKYTIISNAMVREKHKPFASDLREITDLKQLVLHNDEFNTFDFVINTLIEVCTHTIEQAHQCTLIVHYKGKCCVKSGVQEELLPMKNEILNRGLTAEIV